MQHREVLAAAGGLEKSCSCHGFPPPPTRERGFSRACARLRPPPAQHLMPPPPPPPRGAAPGLSPPEACTADQAGVEQRAPFPPAARRHALAWEAKGIRATLFPRASRSASAAPSPPTAKAGRPFPSPDRPRPRASARAARQPLSIQPRRSPPASGF